MQAKRRETDRAETESHFMRNGQTRSEVRGDADPRTFEPVGETGNGSDREVDDAPGHEESDFDQTIRELSATDVTDRNNDQGECRAETETARQFAEAQQNDKSLTSYWQARCDDMIVDEKVTGDLTVMRVTDTCSPQSPAKDLAWATFSSMLVHGADKHISRSMLSRT